MAKTDNSNMKRAKDNKIDEFYTRMCDIEKEIPNYDLSGMVVYCCCDDYRWSNFVKYFKEHFEETGISKLIATNYDNGDGALRYEYDGENETITKLYENGDFLGFECTQIRDEADIIVTNPPFSQFKNFFAWLLNSDKHFLVIGNKNAIQWKSVFPKYMDGKVRFGYNSVNKFIAPNGEIANLEGLGRWFTNMEVHKNNTPMELVEYDEKKHQKYDTFDAVNSNSIKEIPDVDCLIGVPIGIFDYICDSQFEIVGMLCRGSGGIDFAKPIVNGKHLYTRIVIRKYPQCA